MRSVLFSPGGEWLVVNIEVRAVVERRVVEVVENGIILLSKHDRRDIVPGIVWPRNRRDGLAHDVEGLVRAEARGAVRNE
jgi:hypothetical protein